MKSSIANRHALSFRRHFGVCTVAAAFSLALTGRSFADQHTSGNPQLSSNPGAAYTIYLDFGGFNYTGMWSSGTPGTSLAYGDVPASGTFNAQQISDIRTVWASVAQNYVGFNVNVTTVDPATGANAATDLARQNFYRDTPNLMHTIISNQDRNGTDWLSTGTAGISFTGTTNGTDTTSNGENHTNWIFSAGATYNEVGNTRFISQGATHENGHGLNLGHQSDYRGTTQVNDYGIGDNDASLVGPNNPNGSKTGPGSYSAIMGNGDYAQRLSWAVGSTSNGGTGVVQNDVGTMLSSNTVANAAANGRTGGADLHLKNDGIGHTPLTATPLALQPDGTVNFSLATGVIVPKSESNPQPNGVSNYTSDYFTFTLTSSSTITLVAHDGTEFLIAGQADPLSPLRSTLTIRDGAGNSVGVATEDASTLFETYSNLLAAGTYTAEVDSFGGHTQVNDPSNNFNAKNNYDTGAFFLTGTGFTAAVPEPGTWALLASGTLLLLVAARRRSHGG